VDTIAVRERLEVALVVVGAVRVVPQLHLELLLALRRCDDTLERLEEHVRAAVEDVVDEGLDGVLEPDAVELTLPLLPCCAELGDLRAAPGRIVRGNLRDDLVCRGGEAALHRIVDVLDQDGAGHRHRGGHFSLSRVERMCVLSEWVLSCWQIPSFNFFELVSKAPTQTMRRMSQDSTAFVTLSDLAYRAKAERTIRDLRERGQWTGPIVWMTVDWDADPEFCKQTNVRPCRIQHLNTDTLVAALKATPIKPMADNRHFKKLTQWDKLQVFTDYFKRWNRIIFVDAGMRILDSVQPLLDLPWKGSFLAPDDSDPYDNGNRLNCQFDLAANPAVAELMTAEIPDFHASLNSKYFLNCIFVFDTALISTELAPMLVSWMHRYPVMLCNEMGLMNLWFTVQEKVWKPFPQRVGNKYLFGWCELNYKERPNWTAFHFLKYPVTLS
jgi:hypothetical protein